MTSTQATSATPRHATVIAGRLYVAERPGGGGRSHRTVRRVRDLTYWRRQGVTTIVSTTRSRHGLVEYAVAGFNVRWHPLKDVTQARDEIPRMVADVLHILAANPDAAVLVHCDRISEYTSAVYGALWAACHGDTWRDGSPVYTFIADQINAAGLPYGDTVRDVLQVPVPTFRQVAHDMEVDGCRYCGADEGTECDIGCPSHYQDTTNGCPDCGADDGGPCDPECPSRFEGTDDEQDDGYRYIRAYRGSWPGFRYQLWQRIDGRMHRVGTARTEREFKDFLGVTRLEAVRRGVTP